MPTWAIVTLVLGSSAISAFLTFCITRMQVRHSDKRFEKELQRQRETDSRQRRWEVRSKPLLKLRDELAIIVTKYDRLAASADGLRTRFDKTEEAAKKEFQEFLGDINAYIQTGSFASIVAMQYDKEIIERIDEIIKDYRLSYFNIMNYRDSNAAEQTKAMGVFKRNKTRIIEIQELINKRLEEL